MGAGLREAEARFVPLYENKPQLRAIYKPQVCDPFFAL